MAEPNRRLQFSEPEMERLHEHARALGTSYVELIHFLVIQGLDELDGIAREEQGWQAPAGPVVPR